MAAFVKVRYALSTSRQAGVEPGLRNLSSGRMKQTGLEPEV